MSTKENEMARTRTTGGTEYKVEHFDTDDKVWTVVVRYFDLDDPGEIVWEGPDAKAAGVIEALHSDDACWVHATKYGEGARRIAASRRRGCSCVACKALREEN